MYNIYLSHRSFRLTMMTLFFIYLGVTSSLMPKVSAKDAYAIDLAVKVPELGIYGAAANDGTGNSVAVGDLNGDGINDLVVGAPRARGPLSDPSGRPGGGSVRIFFGPINLNDQVDLQQRQANVTIYGPRTNDNLGSTLLIADLNADGKKDLVMQAPGGDIGGIRQDAGVVHVLLGPITSQVRDLGDPTTSADLQIYGFNSGDRVGNSLAAGDFDNDGKLDLAIGSPLSLVNGASRGGAVFIVLGRPNLKGIIDLVDIDNTNDLVFGVDIPDTQFGFSVAFGDVDGDQRLDLICGAPRFDGVKGTRPDSGAVFVLFNNKLESPFVAVGKDSNDLLGSSLAVGDVSNDRIADIVVGAPGSFGVVNQRSGAGEIYVLVGGRFAPGQERDLAQSGQGPEVIFYGDSSGDRLGFPFGIAVGDTNADGISDILVTANGGDGLNNTRVDAGNVYLFKGSSNMSGPRDVGSLDNSDVVVYGARSQDQIGSSSETGSPLLRTGAPLAIGDLTGDGKGDLIIGSPFSDGLLTNPRTDSGVVYVLAQLTPPVQNHPPVITPIPDQVVSEGRSVTLPVSVIDPDKDQVKLSINGPAFVSLTDSGNGTGQIQILPPVNTPKQIYNVVISAIDTGSPSLTSSASFTVTVTPSGPVINSVNYDGSKFLTIKGVKLSPNPTLKINGNILPATIVKSVTNESIKAKGSRTKLKLNSGNNTVIVIVNGVESNAAILQL